jgi:hypothetical protein
MRAFARPETHEYRAPYSVKEIMDWAEKMKYDCNIILSLDAGKLETQFWETIREFTAKMPEATAYQLLRGDLEARSPAKELAIGTPESHEGIEVRCYKSGKNYHIHFASPDLLS